MSEVNRWSFRCACGFHTWSKPQSASRSIFDISVGRWCHRCGMWEVTDVYGTEYGYSESNPFLPPAASDRQGGQS